MKRITLWLLCAATIFAFCGCTMTPVNNSGFISDTSADTSAVSFNLESDYASVPSDISSLQSSDISSVESSKSSYSSALISSASSASKSSASSVSKSSASSKSNSSKAASSSSKSTAKATKTSVFLKAVWFSYIDLDFSGADYDAFKSKIDVMFDSVKGMGMNAVICQVRSNSDAIYPSKYFPFAESYTGVQGKDPGYDPLAYMVKAAHARNLQFHAWINPYRISASTKSLKRLAESNPAKMWLTDKSDQNNENVIYTKTGMYYNPAKEQVRQLVINGIKEILKNYDVDGIQFDDYFYPTTEKSFDKATYDSYKKGCVTPLPLDEWRRTNVSLLVSDSYKALHKYKKKVFGIAPAAAISNDKTDDNYAKYYADIYTWMATKGYIDYIAPQLYFGYNYPVERSRYNKLLYDWCSLKREKGVKLYIGLAPYKTGTVDAKSREWIEQDAIIARQIKDADKLKTDGVMLYSYSYLINTSTKHKQETAEIVKVLEKIK